MTRGERILCAVDPRREIERLSADDLEALLVELAGRTWWNGFWIWIRAWSRMECAMRYPLSEVEEVETGFAGF